MLKKQLYVEPQAEVLEVQGEAVICQSGPYSLSPYQEEDA